MDELNKELDDLLHRAKAVKDGSYDFLKRASAQSDVLDQQKDLRLLLNEQLQEVDKDLTKTRQIFKQNLEEEIQTLKICIQDLAQNIKLIYTYATDMVAVRQKTLSELDTAKQFVQDQVKADKIRKTIFGIIAIIGDIVSCFYPPAGLAISLSAQGLKELSSLVLDLESDDAMKPVHIALTNDNCKSMDLTRLLLKMNQTFDLLKRAYGLDQTSSLYLVKKLPQEHFFHSQNQELLLVAGPFRAFADQSSPAVDIMKKIGTISSTYRIAPVLNVISFISSRFWDLSNLSTKGSALNKAVRISMGASMFGIALEIFQIVSIWTSEDPEILKQMDNLIADMRSTQDQFTQIQRTFGDLLTYIPEQDAGGDSTNTQGGSQTTDPTNNDNSNPDKNDNNGKEDEEQKTPGKDAGKDHNDEEEEKEKKEEKSLLVLYYLFVEYEFTGACASFANLIDQGKFDNYLKQKYTVTEVNCVGSVLKNPTYTEVLARVGVLNSVILTIKKKPKPPKIIFIFCYDGHGNFDTRKEHLVNDGFLVFKGMEGLEPNQKAYQTLILTHELVENNQADLQLLILDCCYAGDVMVPIKGSSRTIFSCPTGKKGIDIEGYGGFLRSMALALEIWAPQTYKILIADACRILERVLEKKYTGDKTDLYWEFMNGTSRPFIKPEPAAALDFLT